MKRRENLTATERKLRSASFWMCGILFFLFSFSYLALFQRDLLGSMQDYLSGERTQYFPYLSALIITGLALLLRYFFNKFARLHGLWEPFSYIPSAILIILFTDFDSTFYGHMVPKHWLWILLGGVLLLLVIIWLNRQLISPSYKDYRAARYSMLASNSFAMTLLFVSIVLLSNTDEVFHYELAVGRDLKAMRYHEALEVGRNSLNSSRELNAMRAVALAATDSLGDLLFEYPQEWGANGLLLPFAEQRTTTYSSSYLSSFMGGRPQKNETTLLFLERMSRTYSYIHPYLKDYYLCGLLLDKNLDKFATELPRLYPDTEWPKHYREAISLWKMKKGDSIAVKSDVSMKDFMQQKSARYESEIARSNHLRRNFGNTYWWYYYYGKK